MALIPPDAGLQLKPHAEAHLQPLSPARPTPVDLPELQTGQSFTARIQEAMPENIYKALVAGKQLTLHLPEGAKAGDLLELVVVDRTARMLIAHQVQRGAPAEAGQQVYPFATISRAAQMIGQLLVPEGEAPAPTQLNRGQPLLTQAQPTAQNLLPALRNAVSQSGMFYESHQAQWVAGKLPLSGLLQEPQGQLSNPALLAAHRIAQEALRMSGAGAETTGRPIQPTALATPAAATGIEGTESKQASAAAISQSVPEALRPLVQQQLEAAAGQRLMWQGAVWPGQTMDWEIEWEQRREEGRSSADDDNERWRTTLALTTPRLGRINATLQLDGGGVRIAIAAPNTGSAGDLRDAVPKLAAALGEAGVPLLAMQVKHE